MTEIDQRRTRYWDQFRSLLDSRDSKLTRWEPQERVAKFPIGPNTRSWVEISLPYREKRIDIALVLVGEDGKERFARLRREAEQIGKELRGLEWREQPEDERSRISADARIERLDADDFVFSLADEITEPETLVEGAACRISVNAYERNPEARRRCIEHHGPSCCICDLSFGSVYGEVADGYIHVHHLRALSEIGEEYTVDPIADLRPVCPNCHAVLHRRTPAYSIEEVRRFLR